MNKVNKYLIDTFEKFSPAIKFWSLEKGKKDFLYNTVKDLRQMSFLIVTVWNTGVFFLV